MEPSSVQEVVSQTEEKMSRAVAHAVSEFSNFRTGRASSVLVEKLLVDYYGSEVPMVQVASFSVPEARTLVISPYDKNALKAIEKAILGSDLGINPSNDGSVIRLAFPQLTEERRKELVKLVRQKAEEGRVAVRNVRRTARHELEQLEKAGVVRSDELDRSEKDLDKVTQDHISELDKSLAHKEKELLEI
jgi:ribosome recycling factor